MRALTLIAAACLAAAVPAFAQSSAPAPAAATTSSPAKKELAAKVVQLQQAGLEAMARGLAEQSVAQLVQQAGAILQTRVPPEKREAVAGNVQAELKKYGDEVVPLLRERALKLAPQALGPALEEKFSEDELKQLVAMLESPVNRKYQQIGPDLNRLMLEKLVADTRPAVEPKLQALQKSLSHALGIEQPEGKSADKPAAKPAPKASAPAKKQ